MYAPHLENGYFSPNKASYSSKSSTKLLRAKSNRSYASSLPQTLTLTLPLTPAFASLYLHLKSEITKATR